MIFSNAWRAATMRKIWHGRSFIMRRSMLEARVAANSSPPDSVRIPPTSQGRLRAPAGSDPCSSEIRGAASAAPPRCRRDDRLDQRQGVREDGLGLDGIDGAVVGQRQQGSIHRGRAGPLDPFGRSCRRSPGSRRDAPAREDMRSHGRRALACANWAFCRNPPGAS